MCPAESVGKARSLECETSILERQTERDRIIIFIKRDSRTVEIEFSLNLFFDRISLEIPFFIRPNENSENEGEISQGLTRVLVPREPSPKAPKNIRRRRVNT